MEFSNFVASLTCTLLLILIPVSTKGAQDGDGVAPKLEFIHLGNAWSNISTSAGKRSIFSTKGDDLFLSCEAPYPIQWNISGLIHPQDIVQIQPPRRDLVENLFKIRVNIFFLDAENYQWLAASAVIACESVKNFAIRDEVAVFVKGNNDFVETFETTVTDSKLIPCPTTDPTTGTDLYQKNADGSEALVQDVSYNPVEGFHSNDIFRGDFVCRKGSFAIAFNALSTTTNSDNQYYPHVKEIIRFSDEVIEFKCSSKTSPIKLVFDSTNDTTVIFTRLAERELAVQVTKAKNTTDADNTSIKGKAACIIAGTKVGLIHEWTFEFIKSPELYLDNIEGEADCLSGLSPKLAQTVRCKNSMDCNFMSQCLRDRTFCNFKKQKQFYAETDTGCWIDEQNKARDCVSVPFSHLNGLVQCSTKGLTRKWEFFISLDYVRYTNWKDAPIRELVRVEELENTENTGKSRFLCTASAYLFGDSLMFQLEYSNGTKTLIKGQDKEGSQQPSRPSSLNSRKIYELNIKAYLDIAMPADVNTVNCIAPFWNSTEYLVGSRNLNNKLPITPHSLTMDEDKSLMTFYFGEMNKSLSCISDKSVRWLFTDQLDGNESIQLEIATERFEELKIITDDGKGTTDLFFPLVSKKYTGRYKCVDDNEAVIVEYKVKAISKEKPLTTSAVTYTGLAIILIIIAAVLIAATLIFIRKRQKRHGGISNY